MPEPKFEAGQYIKYQVGTQVRYSRVVEPVWNSAAGCYLYRLNEVMAMPVYREDWLEAVGEAELKWLAEELDAHHLSLGKMGYIYHNEGKVYEMQRSEDTPI